MSKLRADNTRSDSATSDVVALIAESPLFAAAVENARQSFRVYPARPRGKEPLFRGWQRAATTNVDYLAKVWRKHPAANVGVLCDRLAVLDADSSRGIAAVEELALPTTTTVRTARGCHWYFLEKTPPVPGILEAVELRGVGLGVLGAGSAHPSGRIYEWEIAPWEAPPPPLPPQIRELTQKGPPPTVDGVSPVTEGRRSVSLLRIAGSLRGRHGLGELEPILQTINRTTCVPPLPEAKVAKLAADGAKWRIPPWIADETHFSFGDSRLKPIERSILHVLAVHADDAGKCFPGIRRIRKLTGAGPRTVCDAIARLEDLGRIRVVRGGRGRSNRYELQPSFLECGANGF